MLLQPGKRAASFGRPEVIWAFQIVLKNIKCGLKVAAKCNGTLNNWQDRDTGGTAEIAMPIKDMEVFGYKFGPRYDWTILTQGIWMKLS